MKLTFVSMATLIDATDSVYLTIVFKDEHDNEYTWNMYGEDAVNTHFDMAFCITAMRDIEAKQKRAQEMQYGDFQYAEAQNGNWHICGDGILGGR